MSGRFKLAVLCFTLFHLPPAGAQVSPEIFFDAVDNFMQQAVADGGVRYAAIRESPAALRRLLEMLAGADLRRFESEQDQKAFWLDAYNVLTISGIVAKYPVASPMDIKGFFDLQNFVVARRRVTLNLIENNIIRPGYRDPRIHFALVCAARGCPEIEPFAYRGDQLDNQLEMRARKILNDSRYVSISAREKKVAISEIFKWYASDFTANGKTVLEYINRYRETKIPLSFAVVYIPYDWSLNEWRPKAEPEPAKGALRPRPGENLQAYTPSRLLRPGQWELKQFNNLYTQTAFYDETGEKRQLTTRSSYFTGIANILVGTWPDINLGVDLYFKAVRNDLPESSPFAVFGFVDDADGWKALTSIAPKIKFAPFASMPEFAVQTAFVIPLAADLEGRGRRRPFLEYDDFQWWTQFFLDLALKRALRFYLESGYFLRFDKNTPAFSTPIKGFINAYPGTRWTTYVQLELAPTWEGFGWSEYYSQIGAGVKFLIQPNLELESLFTVFPFGKNKGAGQTYNFGFRWIL